MKYIDAEKLIAEIERLKNRNERRLDNIVPIRRKDTMDEEQLAKIELRDKIDKAYLNGVLITLSDILSFITALQQEQPEVDATTLRREAIGKAMEVYPPSINEDADGMPYDEHTDLQQGFITGYELGFNARKEE